MHGLVSLLDAEHDSKVRRIWRELDDQCKYSGVNVTPIPHFSWGIAEEFDWTRIHGKLSQIAKRTRPFFIKTDGISMFTGPNPVIYIPIVRTLELSQLHSKIWRAVNGFASSISNLYAPDSWMPHITLAFQDVSEHNLTCLIQYLAFQNFSWTIGIDNISIIKQGEYEVGFVDHRFELTG